MPFVYSAQVGSTSKARQAAEQPVDDAALTDSIRRIIARGQANAERMQEEAFRV